MTPDYTNIKTQTLTLLREKFFHPKRSYSELTPLFDDLSARWSGWVNSNSLEEHVNEWLATLGVSHTGFWRGPGEGLPPYFGINATLKRTVMESFVFWDVLPGGLSDQAGIKPGDALLEIDNVDLAEEPRFKLGETYLLTINHHGKTRRVQITLPGRGPNDRPPMAEVHPLTYAINGHTGILKATSFPGVIGFEFLAEVANALKAFETARCDRLILDLRNNCGGGLASMRLMSLLTPNRQFVGYSMTRRSHEDEVPHDALPAIRRLPKTKFSAIPMGLRFRFIYRDRSLRLFTEGLGSLPFHQRIVVLVNEHTRSAAEMIAAFAKQEKLAHLIGTKTAGEVLGAANFSVGSDYKLRIPITAWFTSQGNLIEGHGIVPDTVIASSLEDLRAGRDLPMENALTHVSVL